MRTIFDRFAKDLVGSALAPGCQVVPEREISGDPQRIDLWCEPDPARIFELERHGILRRFVAEGACAFEFFHQPPSLLELMRSLRKILTLRQSSGGPEAQRAPLWIIAGGRPAQVFAELPSLRADPSWFEGVYATDPGLGLYLIVTSEIPNTPDTLILRLLGAGRTLRQAFHEVRSTRADDPVRRVAIPFMITLHRTAKEHPLDERELQELAMETQDLYEIWRQELLAQGEATGEARGEARGEAKALLAVLAARGIAVSQEDSDRISGTTDIAQLDRWLVRAATATTIDEVFG